MANRALGAACALTLLLFSMQARAARPHSLSGRAGRTRLVLDSSDVLRGMQWAAYAKAVRPLVDMEGFVVLRAPLVDVTGDVSYGLNAVLPIGDVNNVLNVSWALITQAGKPPMLLVDGNADGDLSNDAPVFLTGRVEEKSVGEDRRPMRDSSGRRMKPLRVRWQVESTSEDLRLRVWSCRERRGFLKVDERRIAFSLRTCYGAFDSAGALLGLDLNGDGEIAFLESDPETFDIESGTIVMDGREYSLSVTPSGRRLTLDSTGRLAVERAVLEVGTKAPEFPGKVRLSDFRGRRVLLDLWSPHCTGAREMAASLVAAKSSRPEVQFISITDAPGDEAREVSASWDHDWLQVVGDEGAGVFQAYRVESVPTYYVIDAEGTILARGHAADWSRLVDLLSDGSEGAR